MAVAWRGKDYFLPIVTLNIVIGIASFAAPGSLGGRDALSNIFFILGGVFLLIATTTEFTSTIALRRMRQNYPEMEEAQDNPLVKKERRKRSNRLAIIGAVMITESIMLPLVLR